MSRVGIGTSLAIICVLRSVAGVNGQTLPIQQHHRDSYLQLRTALAGGGNVDDNSKCGLPMISQALAQHSSLDLKGRSALMSLLAREERQKSIIVGNFKIHYDTVGNNVPAILDDSLHRIEGTADEYADSVAAIANYVYAFETGTLGYATPPSDGGAGGGNEYDIYIEDIPAYGFTSPEVQIDSKPDGGRYTSYVTIDNDFTFVYPAHNRGLPALRVTLAHEFHHAIQIGSYGYWNAERYYLEIASVWMEDVVYSDVNDYYEYMRFSNGQPRGQFRTPEVTFTSSDPTDILMYSRAIWGHYIEKKFGRDAMRCSWEHIRNVRPLEAIDNMLEEHGIDFRAAFAEWTLWNYFTGERADSARYYPEGSNYPLMTQTPIELSSERREVDGTLDGLSSKYYQVLSESDTLTLIVSNVNFSSAQSTSYSFSILLSRTKLDDTYREAGAGIFTKLIVPDETNWFMWDLYKNNVQGGRTREGGAFPNPFIPGQQGSAFFPVSSQPDVSGTLTIFSSSMDLIYSFSGVPIPHPLGPLAFSWNGRNNSNRECPSGVYVFVIQLPDRITKGKIALIREGK